MKVKKRLQINSAISVTAAFLICLIGILAIFRINQDFKESEIANEIVNSSFERMTLRNDYLRTGSERAKVQWLAKADQINRLLQLAKTTYTHTDHKKTIEELIEDDEASVTLFSQIVQQREKERFEAVPAELAQETENRLITQLNMTSYDIVLTTRNLREMEQEELFATLKIAGWSIFFVIAVMIAAAIIHTWAIFRSIINRIGLLHQGASVIGEGNLDHRIKINGDDEFTDLSAAFNAMTAQLQASYLELRESEERYRALIKASSQVLYRMNADWSEMRQLQGGSFIADTEKPNPNWLREYIHADDRTLFLEAAAEAVRTGNVFELVYRVRRLDDTTGWAFSRAVPMRNGAGNIVEWFGAASDITDRKQAEEDIHTLNEELIKNVHELESANREMEAFIYSVAHDLRSPLRSISGFSEILLKQYADKFDDKGKDKFQLIIRNAAQMNQIIDDLLDLSRISRQEIHRQEVDLSRIARLVMTELQAAHPDRQVDFAAAEHIPAFADEHLLQIALANLLGNAWKFTSKTDNARIEFGMAQQDGETVYYVRDNGAGFDQDYVEKIFLPFHRLHLEQDFAGTGIGLAIVERVIQRHGGKIRAEGRINEGAVFFFTLK